MADLVETVDTQNLIIRMQSSIIDELFRNLSQLITAEELDRMAVIDTINEAAKLRADLEREG